MTFADAIVLDVVTGPRSQLSLPEHRQIELYSKRKALSFAATDVADGIPVTEIAGVCRAFVALDAALAGPGTAGGGTSWERCRNLPRFSATQRLLGELYRVARLVWVVASDARGRISYCDGLIDFDAIVAPSVLAAKITPAGLRLLESAIVYYLTSRLEPYPGAYVEAMLTEYYLDLLGEVRSYSRRESRPLPVPPQAQVQADTSGSIATIPGPRSATAWWRSRSARRSATLRAIPSTSSSCTTICCTSCRSRR